MEPRDITFYVLVGIGLAAALLAGLVLEAAPL